MFLDSVLSALKVMTYWETHVAALVYLSLFMAPVIAVCFLIKKRQGVCIKYLKMLLMPVLEAVAAAVFVLTLFPIILGLGEDALWGFPLRIIQLAPGGFFGFLAVLIVLAVALTCIPKLAKLRSFKTLVLGGVSLVFVQIVLGFINPVIEMEAMDFVPGFGFILGIIAMSGVLSRLEHYASVFFTSGLGNKFHLKEGIAEIIVLPVIAISGFIPVFVYGAWLA
jgi:hypothetical protein